MKLFRRDPSARRHHTLTTAAAVAAYVAGLLFGVFGAMVLTALLARPAHAAQPQPQPCDWSAPGAARYTGTTAQAVENYLDMPPAARAEIRAKLESRPRRFDAVATITRDAIHSGATQYENLRDMHWAGGLCRGPVTRARWAPGDKQQGLVYCSGDDCIIVPSVCGNVARVDRVKYSAARATATPAHQSHQADPRPSAVSPLDEGEALVPRGSTEGSAPQTFASASAAAQRSREIHGPSWPALPGWSVIGGGGPLHPPRQPVAGIPCPVPAVPEPTPLALLALGLPAVLVARRRRVVET